MTDPSITDWLVRLRDGDVEALDRLLPLVYDELRSLARHQFRNEDPGHTLGATALVHEAYMRLAERDKLRPDDRRHFFAIAGQAMRRVLIDHARARKRSKRGSGRVALSLEEMEGFVRDSTTQLEFLDEVLDRLAGANPRAARVVRCRFFVGLTIEETAQALGVSLKTVQRDWLLARAWIRKEMERSTHELTAPSDATVRPDSSVT